MSNHPYRLRDSQRERDILQRLRELTEKARYEIVKELLQEDKGIGLLMASGSLRQKRYFQEILEMGFQEGDASIILPWPECAVPKIGFRKVRPRNEFRVCKSAIVTPIKPPPSWAPETAIDHIFCLRRQTFDLSKPRNSFREYVA
jgi:hypothetical protein